MPSVGDPPPGWAAPDDRVAPADEDAASLSPPSLHAETASTPASSSPRQARGIPDVVMERW